MPAGISFPMVGLGGGTPPRSRPRSSRIWGPGSSAWAGRTVSGVREGLVASAARLFEGWERTDERGGWAEGLWGELEKAGLTLTSVPEGSGGTGGSLSEAVAVLRLVGRHAAPVPLAETDILAEWALSASGLPVPGGPLTAAPMRSDEGVVFRRVGAGWALSGRARCVPAARYAARLVVVGRREGGGTMVAAVDPGCCGISRGENLAGETRDDVTLDGVRAAGDEVAPAGAAPRTFGRSSQPRRRCSGSWPLRHGATRRGV
jgi:alkylation response protein AidB-like acyl-CoA dehydrogenase